MRIKKMMLLIAAVLSVSLIQAGAVNAETFAEAEIPVSCRVSRSVPEEYRDFTYTLTAESGDCPMPEGSEGGSKIVHMRSSGKIQFGKISLDHPEMYRYTVRETTPERNRFRRDRSVYSVSLLTDTYGKVRITVKNSRGEKQDSIIFRNSYRKDDSGHGSPKTGDDERPAIWLLILLAGAGAAAAVISGKRWKWR